MRDWCCVAQSSAKSPEIRKGMKLNFVLRGYLNEILTIWKVLPIDHFVSKLEVFNLPVPIGTSVPHSIKSFLD